MRSRSGQTLASEEQERLGVLRNFHGLCEAAVQGGGGCVEESVQGLRGGGGGLAGSHPPPLGPRWSPVVPFPHMGAQTADSFPEPAVTTASETGQTERVDRVHRSSHFRSGGPCLPLPVGPSCLELPPVFRLLSVPFQACPSISFLRLSLSLYFTSASLYTHSQGERHTVSPLAHRGAPGRPAAAGSCGPCRCPQQAEGPLLAAGG